MLFRLFRLSGPISSSSMRIPNVVSRYPTSSRTPVESTIPFSRNCVSACSLASSPNRKFSTTKAFTVPRNSIGSPIPGFASDILPYGPHVDIFQERFRIRSPDDISGNGELARQLISALRDIERPHRHFPFVHAPSCRLELRFKVIPQWPLPVLGVVGPD